MKKTLPANIKLALLPVMACAIALALLPLRCTCNCGDSVPTGGWKPPYANTIAFVRQGASGTELCVMDSDGTELTTLTNDVSDDFFYAWSPDGTRIAYIADDEDIYVMDADGSNKVQLTDDTDENTTPQWSPDGSKIAYAAVYDGIYVVNEDGSNITNLADSDEFGFVANPIWSPDGTRIAYMGGNTMGTMGFHYDIYVMNADGSNRINITNDVASIYSPAWSPDSTKIVFFLSFYSNRNGGICVANADGSNMVHLTEDQNRTYGPEQYRYPQWSPDGSKIAFSASLERSDQTEICVINADGTELTNISNNSEGDDRYPSWSYDGSKIAFASNRDGNWEIYVMNADGSEQTNISNSLGDEMMLSWTW